MGILDLPEEVLLSIFSYVPLYNIFFSVQRTCLAWRDLCLNHILWREVHYTKEFDERLTKVELLSVLKQVSRGIHRLVIDSDCTEDDFSKLIQCVLHEDADVKHISSLKTRSIPGGYIEPLLGKCSGLSSIEVGFPYVLYNDGDFFEAMKKLPHLKVFKITPKMESIENHSSYENAFNKHLADMFSGLLELEVVQLFSTDTINDSTVYALLKNCQNLKKVTLLGCSNVSDAGFRSFPVRSGITSLCLYFISIGDEGVEQACRSCPDLREITLVGCDVTDTSIKHVCAHCPNLETLSVSPLGKESNVTDDGLKYVIHNGISLRSLKVSDCPQVLELGVDLLAQCCYNLVELNLSGFKTITDDTLQTIAAHCTNLETVDVSKCFRVRGAGVNSLVTSCRRLRTLNVANCRFLWELNFVAFMHMESPFYR